MPTVRDHMTTALVTRQASDTARTAAQCMDSDAIGDVLVLDDGELCGIVTDRDLVVRVLAAGRDADEVTLGEICSRDLQTASPDDDLDEVGNQMRRAAIRRVPVLEDGTPVGILSIGDLAVVLDEHSALADISAAPADQ